MLVGYPLNGRGRNVLNLGAMLARSTGEDLVVCAVVPQPWLPRGVHVDAEYHTHTSELAQAALDQARDDLPEDMSAEFIVRRARSVPSGLLQTADEVDATMIVLGSSTAGMFGYVTLSSVSDRLLHSSHLPVALATRGFRAGIGDQVTRVTVAYGGTEADDYLVSAVRDVVARTKARIRLASFAVQAAPPDTALLRAEANQVVAEWTESIRTAAAEVLAGLPEDASRAEPPEIVVGRGEDWAEALDDVYWNPGDVLVAGSSSYGPIARVFIGSHASKIIRHAPVPVIIVPRSTMAPGSE